MSWVDEQALLPQTSGVAVLVIVTQEAPDATDPALLAEPPELHVLMSA